MQRIQIIILGSWCLSFAYFYLCGGFIFLTPTPMRLVKANDFINHTPFIFILLQCIYIILLTFLLFSFSKKTQNKNIVLFSLTFNYMWFVWTELSSFQTVNEYKKVAKIALITLALLIALKRGKINFKEKQ